MQNKDQSRYPNLTLKIPPKELSLNALRQSSETIGSDNSLTEHCPSKDIRMETPMCTSFTNQIKKYTLETTKSALSNDSSLSPTFREQISLIKQCNTSKKDLTFQKKEPNQPKQLREQFKINYLLRELQSLPLSQR